MSDTGLVFCGVPLEEAERRVRDYERIARELAAVRAEVRPATRWERLVLACRRAWAHVRV